MARRFLTLWHFIIFPRPTEEEAAAEDFEMKVSLSGQNEICSEWMSEMGVQQEVVEGKAGVGSLYIYIYIFFVLFTLLYYIVVKSLQQHC